MGGGRRVCKRGCPRCSGDCGSMGSRANDCFSERVFLLVRAWDGKPRGVAWVSPVSVWVCWVVGRDVRGWMDASGWYGLEGASGRACRTLRLPSGLRSRGKPTEVKSQGRGRGPKRDGKHAGQSNQCCGWQEGVNKALENQTEGAPLGTDERNLGAPEYLVEGRVAAWLLREHRPGEATGERTRAQMFSSRRSVVAFTRRSYPRHKRPFCPNLRSAKGPLASGCGCGSLFLEG